MILDEKCILYFKRYGQISKSVQFPEGLNPIEDMHLRDGLSKDYIILYIEKNHRRIQKAPLHFIPIGLFVILENQIGNMSR
jgi:hypothetical protein